ncbi:MAG: hypothetical protein ACM3O3_02740 [Syntrophothermus sp.]
MKSVFYFLLLISTSFLGCYSINNITLEKVKENDLIKEIGYYDNTVIVFNDSCGQLQALPDRLTGFINDSEYVEIPLIEIKKIRSNSKILNANEIYDNLENEINEVKCLNDSIYYFMNNKAEYKPEGLYILGTTINGSLKSYPLDNVSYLKTKHIFETYDYVKYSCLSGCGIAVIIAIVDIIIFSNFHGFQ